MGDGAHLEQLPQSPRKRHGARTWCVGQNQRKLFAAVSRRHIARPHAHFSQQPPYLFQAGVTLQVAACVVEKLEVIEVAQHQRKRRSIPACCNNLVV
ncbi:hypothetical protein D3C71_1769780 [compost metagenome]